MLVPLLGVGQELRGQRFVLALVLAALDRARQAIDVDHPVLDAHERFRRRRQESAFRPGEGKDCAGRILLGQPLEDRGDVDRGFAQMMEMVNASRLSNAMRAAALMRRAVLESVAHARGRLAFGGALFDKPLLRQNLLEMVLDADIGWWPYAEPWPQYDHPSIPYVEAAILVTGFLPGMSAALLAAVWSRRWWGPEDRVRRGVCGVCSYALHGLVEQEDGCCVCPECGAAWRLAKDSMRRRA